MDIAEKRKMFHATKANNYRRTIKTSNDGAIEKETKGMVFSSRDF